MKYFKEKEFVCRCCGELPPFARENIEALVREVLDPVREKLGKPIVVDSGYRCPKCNAAVGGATQSQHLVGEAADIRCHTDLADLTDKLAKAIVENGKYDQLILYPMLPRFVHVSWKRNGGNRQQILRKVGNGYRPVTRKEVLAL